MGIIFVVTLVVLSIVGVLVQKCVTEVNAMDEHYDVKNNSYVFETAPDIVRKHGYPVETHTVTTEDGYLLTLHRIPGSPKAAPSGVKTPVLLQHGIEISGESFLWMGPEQSLGFLLADQGYDVWLGNSRGNFYSRKHLVLSPEDPKFWQFSWHEMGVYDLSATIDYILETTNQKQLFCIGHSMGGTIFFVLASTRPEYNQKMRLLLTMAPGVYFHPLRSRFFGFIGRHIELITWFLKMFGINQLFPRIQSVQMFLGYACREGNPLFEVCMSGYFGILGHHRESFDTTLAPMMFSHIFAGTSVNTLLHFVAIYFADRFQTYDPTVKPGVITRGYNLSQVSAPVSLLYADNDSLIAPEGVMRLRKELPNVVSVYRLPDDLAAHMDFVFAKNLTYIVNKEIIDQLNKYNN